MYEVENETIKSIGEFSVVWAVFENDIFDRGCSARAIMRKISHNEMSPEDNELLCLCACFRNELIQFAGGDESKVIHCLKFRSSEHDASDAVSDWIERDRCTYVAPIAAAYRIRCNMFHGEKMAWTLNKQRELFDITSQVLNKYIEMENQVTIFNNRR